MWHLPCAGIAFVEGGNIVERIGNGKKQINKDGIEMRSLVFNNDLDSLIVRICLLIWPA